MTSNYYAIISNLLFLIVMTNYISLGLAASVKFSEASLASGNKKTLSIAGFTRFAA
jgi:hypothetical protein